MAYPTVNAPYGLKPINLIGGQVFAGQTRELPIASNYGTAIYNGDIVRLDGGFIVKEAGTTTVTSQGVTGVFLGCSYTNPSTGQLLFANSYPGSVVASNIVAYVADDPDQLYKAASVGNTINTTGLVISAVSQVVVGNNATLILNTGSATTGNSKTGVFANAVSTSLPMRVVDGVPDTATSNGYTELIVKFNFGYHSYDNATGVA